MEYVLYMYVCLNAHDATRVVHGRVCQCMNSNNELITSSYVDFRLQRATLGSPGIIHRFYLFSALPSLG
jgi:hypothetical protein